MRNLIFLSQKLIRANNFVSFRSDTHSFGLGAENSLRGKKDGVTYFGCKKKIKAGDTGLGEIVNDIVIPNKDKETNDRHRGRHFQIEYCIDTNSYKIRDLGVGFGAFIKLEHPLLLKENNLISMGSSFLIINFTEELKESLAYSNSQDPEDNTRGGKSQFASPNFKDVVLVTSSNTSSVLFSLSSFVLSDLETVTEEKNRRSGINTSIATDITIKIFGGPNYGEI